MKVKAFHAVIAFVSAQVLSIWGLCYLNIQHSRILKNHQEQINKLGDEWRRLSEGVDGLATGRWLSSSQPDAIFRYDAKANVWRQIGGTNVVHPNK